MPKAVKHYLLLSILLSSFFSYSQSDFLKGYAVNNAGDTTKGYVRVKNRVVNPKSLEFKPDLAAAVQEFTLSNCIAFGFDDAEKYELYNVKISLGGTAAKRLSVGIDTAFMNDIVFLKVLDKGKNISVFSYVDHNKVRFYVTDQTELVPYELLYYTFLDPEDGVSIVKNNRIFRGQLILLATRFGLSTSQIDKLKSIDYDLTDITAAARAINHKSKFKFPLVSFYVGVGANTHLMYSGVKVPWGGSYQSLVKPLANIGVDVFANPATKRLIFRFETSISLSENKFYTANPNPGIIKYSYEFKGIHSSLSVQALYNLYNRQNIKFYLGTGGSLDFMKALKYEEKYEYSNKIDILTPAIKGTSWSVPFLIGTQFNKRFDLFGSYALIPGVNEGVYHEAKRIRVGVNYHFGKQ